MCLIYFCGESSLPDPSQVEQNLMGSCSSGHWELRSGPPRALPYCRVGSVIPYCLALICTRRYLGAVPRTQVPGTVPVQCTSHCSSAEERIVSTGSCLVTKDPSGTRVSPKTSLKYRITSSYLCLFSSGQRYKVAMVLQTRLTKALGIGKSQEHSATMTYAD